MRDAVCQVPGRPDRGGIILKILITGNMGYVGPVLVRHLRAEHPSDILTGIDTGYFAHCLTGAPCLPEIRLDQQILADVRHPETSWVAGIDAIVYLAALSNDAIGQIDEETTLEINARSAVRLAELARGEGVRRFVFASSCSVYGTAEEGPRTESSDVLPLTAYARSKVEAEAALTRLADENFSVTCLRFATACGMSERLRLDLVLNDFVASALATGKITILSDGTPWRPLIHVADMARAIDWAVRRPAESGGSMLVVNAGANEANYRIRELADAVAREIPGTEVEINPRASPDKRSYRVDFSLFARLAPNHQPKFDLGAMIRDLNKGLTSIGFRDAEFRKSSMMRRVELWRLQHAGLLDSRLAWVRSPF